MTQGEAPQRGMVAPLLSSWAEPITFHIGPSHTAEEKPELARTGHVGYLWAKKDIGRNPSHDLLPLDLTATDCGIRLTGENHSEPKDV
jgi:hypothetical protein